MSTQGLGDTGVGDEERLIKVLGEDVDLILFIRMPHPNADAWRAEDINLYSVANRALANYLPLEKWSFLVLNQTNDPLKGDNSTQCDVLRNQLPQTIRVINPVITANCADPTEAQTKILEPIIRYLVGNIKELDRKYAEAYQQDLNQLQSQIQAELEKARNVLVKKTSVQDKRLFEELFEGFWEKLTVGLDKLISQLRDQPKPEDVHFQEQVKQVIEEAKNDTAIPVNNGKTALDKIGIMIVTTGDAERAYSEYLDRVRTYLTRHFFALDDGLNQTIEQGKMEIAELFIEQLGFGNLTDKKGLEFIKAMAKLLPEEHGPIKEGFQNLAEYKLSFKGLILPRIRPCLQDLTPSPRKIPLTANNRQDAQEQILNNLLTLHGEAIYKCENALSTMLCEPIQAALAIVEEFKERVVNAEKVKTEWRLFLDEEKAKIWVNEFGGGDPSVQHQKEWQGLLERAIESNSLNHYQLIN